MIKKNNMKSKTFYCSKCLFSNHIVLPSVITNDDKNQSNKERVSFKDGVCQACLYCKKKYNKKIDWDKREKQLNKFLENYRSKNSSYDCIVPGSGGKDSVFQAHILKTKYNMNPLTVTFSPHLYSSIGVNNFHKWPLKGDVHNFLYTPSGKLHSKLASLAFKNLLHPFQPFIFGQRNYVVHMARLFNIKLIFTGESHNDYGADDIKEEKEKFLFPFKYWTTKDHKEPILISGLTIEELKKKHSINREDLKFYLPITRKEAIESEIKYIELGYFEKFSPQENYFLATQVTGYEPNDRRTEQTYSKYSSIDDKLDPFHYYTAYVKFGYGRATTEASNEIRHNYISRKEGLKLVRKYDHEFPARYFNDILDYLNISEKEFYKTLDKFRNPKIWKKVGKDYKYCKNWQLINPPE